MSIERSVKRAARRRELDRIQWSDLDKIQYRFDLMGGGEAIAGPFHFGRAFDLPPYFTYSIVGNPAEIVCQGADADPPVLYDENVLLDPGFEKFIDQAGHYRIPDYYSPNTEWRWVEESPDPPSKTTDVAADDFPYWQGTNSTNWWVVDHHQRSGRYCAEGIGQRGDGAAGGTSPLHLEPIRFRACKWKGGGQDKYWAGRISPGDSVRLGVWMQIVFLDNPESLTPAQAARFAASMDPIGNRGPNSTGANSDWQVTANRTIVGQSGLWRSMDVAGAGYHYYELKWNSINPIPDIYMFNIEIDPLVSGNAKIAFYVDDISLVVTGSDSKFVRKPRGITVGVSEWLRDEQDMYVGANLWVKGYQQRGPLVYGDNILLDPGFEKDDGGGPDGKSIPVADYLGTMEWHEGGPLGLRWPDQSVDSYGPAAFKSLPVVQPGETFPKWMHNSVGFFPQGLGPNHWYVSTANPRSGIRHARWTYNGVTPIQQNIPRIAPYGFTAPHDGWPYTCRAKEGDYIKFSVWAAFSIAGQSLKMYVIFYGPHGAVQYLDWTETDALLDTTTPIGTNYTRATIEGVAPPNTEFVKIEIFWDETGTLQANDTLDLDDATLEVRSNSGEAPEPILSQVTTSFEGRVLKNYANIYPIEPKAAPTEVRLT